MSGVLLGVAATLTQPLLIGELIEATGLGEPLAWLIAALVALFLADAGLSATQSYLIGRAGESIARALLRRPAVILLDEATSQLDSDTEAALRRVSRESAVIAVAHRLSTVADADRIVVLDEGPVRAVCTHRELMEGDDLYRRLFSGRPRADDGR